ncbi:hypothetical protein PMAL9190_02334 [Photobacterium malacitanum]|uniref:DUF11 domain-containing protein n=1 Tax=Photobacterium malacitanum TaxID=2204294 RepID=A0A1Y6MKK8_9GAMM|nr:hypothetical protein [Photobacterium malacitanum]SMY36340.1 hypothetical protein PMAL9190_02334 [Photobacterium malacitanum]
MNVFYRLVIKLSLLIIASASFFTFALTESGTVIKNQAGATYRDSADILRSTTSNLVETLVQPVAALTLINDQSKLGAPGRTVTFNHVLTNTGNSTDSFKLDYVIPSNVITGAQVYPDANNDGVADAGATAIASGDIIGPLAAGESFDFVIVADIDAAAAINASNSLTVTATSQAVTVDGIAVANNAVGTETNTDTLTVTNLPIIEITKAISAGEGASPSGPYTVTFTYTNVGLTNMDPLQTNGVILTDELPEGMRFNGKVAWSVSGTIITGSGVTTGATEVSGDHDLSFTTCIAPDPSCANNDEIVFTMDGLASDESATVSFEVNIDAGLATETLYNSGVFGFDENNSGTVEVSEQNKNNTNRVPFLITANYAVIANNGGCDAGSNDINCDGSDDTNHEIVEVATATQGERVSFTNYIWNQGNAEDIFNITLDSSTFPTGTSFFLYKSDGVTPLLDTDNDGKSDTGIIPAFGQTCQSYHVTDSNGVCGYKVVVVATLPSSSTGGPYQVVKTATSSNNTAKSNTVVDKLGTITASTVDLTNNFRAETSITQEDSCDAADDNCGFGVGAESSAVTTNLAAPGATTRFTLYVTNTSGTADGYTLQYSDSDFAENTLPAGWSVTFKDSTENIITNIPVLGPDDAVMIYADVTIPETAPTALQSLYFRVVSAATGAVDTKHDAINVDNSSMCIVFEADSEGVTHSGGAIVYKHNILNNSNDAYTNIALMVSNSNPDFTAVVYEDNGDGVFSAADTVITEITTLAGNETKVLFVKVFTPGNITQGSKNITTVAATVSCGTAQVIDITTIANTNMKITKEQTPDLDCDGVSDTTVYVTSTFAVSPGQCIIYRLTAENIGIEDAKNVKLNDATPAYTTFNVVASKVPAISTGTISANASINGSTGSIVGTINSVSPGDSETMEFGIKIDN